MYQILVTGGAGYIGAHTLVALIASGYEPVVIDNLSRSSKRLLDGVKKITGKEFPFYPVDCTQTPALADVFLRHPRIRAVMHFAAFKSVHESVEQPLLYYRNNTGSVIALLEAMRSTAANRFIFSSSCTVYGQPEIIPVNEEAPFGKAESPYGATKQVSERILEDAVKADPRLRVVSLRYFNPIGAHDSGSIGELPLGAPNNLVPFLTQAAIGKRKKLTVFGSDYDTADGTCLRDYIHVSDLAEAHVSALTRINELPNRFEAFNLGTGNPTSVLELIRLFEKETGVGVPFEIGPRRPGDVVKVYADPAKSNRLLGWKAKRTIADALRDAWTWEKQLTNEAH